MKQDILAALDNMSASDIQDIRHRLESRFGIPPVDPPTASSPVPNQPLKTGPASAAKEIPRA